MPGRAQMFPAGAGLELGMQPLALECGLQPQAASEHLQRWDGHGAVGSSPGCLQDRPCLALLLLLWFCLPLVQAFFLESRVSEEFRLSDGVTKLSARLLHGLEHRMEENISS